MPQFAASFLRLTALFYAARLLFAQLLRPLCSLSVRRYSRSAQPMDKSSRLFSKSPLVLRESPQLSATTREDAMAERHKKRTVPQFIVQSFCISIQTAGELPTFFGRSSLRSPGSRIVSLVDGFLCSAFCSSFGLLFHGFCTGCRRALHLATASLGFLSGTLRAILSSSFGLGGSFAGSFLAFSAGLLALGSLFCGAIGSLLPLGAGFLCVLFAARFHFLFSGFSVYLHHLCGSGGTYGEHGGESQTAEEGVELELHNRVVVWFCLCFGVSFVKTHEVIFLQTSDFSRLQLQM